MWKTLATGPEKFMLLQCRPRVTYGLQVSGSPKLGF
jgi:hypothetical protein